MARYRRYLFIALLWLGSLAVVFYLARRPRSDSFSIHLSTVSPSRLPVSSTMQVDVQGAVARPDVYTLPAGSIVRDAILAAGGATDEADLSRLNQAEPLSNGMWIYVPQKEETPPPRPTNLPTPPNRRANISLVNINQATQAELETLPGIGPVLAQRIVAGRPYDRVDDLLRVFGIGPKTYEQFKDYITVDEAP